MFQRESREQRQGPVHSSVSSRGCREGDLPIVCFLECDLVPLGSSLGNADYLTGRDSAKTV